MDLVKKLIKDVPDFPKEGIVFKDITPVLADPAALKQSIDAFAARYAEAGVTRIAGIESRGFIFGTALAYTMGIGFVPIRKPGKLPRETYEQSYALEYGEDTIQIHRDAAGQGDRVVIIDDLLATGGTAAAAVKLVEKCGATVHEVGVVIELGFLEGRSKLEGAPVHALLTY